MFLLTPGMVLLELLTLFSFCGVVAMVSGSGVINFGQVIQALFSYFEG